MGIEANKKIIEQYYTVFNKGGDVSFEKYFSADFIDHNGYPEQTRGPAGVRAGYRVWSKAFPDCHAELADIIAEDDKVVVRTIAKGTHQGEFMGVGPTGKQIRIEGISIFRLSESKIQERWGLIKGEKLRNILSIE
jgi:steroid delta-isomerase-like uncharacterized protein